MNDRPAQPGTTNTIPSTDGLGADDLPASAVIGASAPLYQTTLDAAFAAIPADYRFYTADASIKGRVRVLLKLQGQAKIDWHDLGEVLDVTGKDTRPPLYRSGTAPTLAEAIMKAIENDQ